MLFNFESSDVLLMESTQAGYVTGSTPTQAVVTAASQAETLACHGMGMAMPMAMAMPWPWP